MLRQIRLSSSLAKRPLMARKSKQTGTSRFGPVKSSTGSSGSPETVPDEVAPSPKNQPQKQIQPEKPTKSRNKKGKGQRNQRDQPSAQNISSAGDAQNQNKSIRTDQTQVTKDQTQQAQKTLKKLQSLSSNSHSESNNVNFNPPKPVKPKPKAKTIVAKKPTIAVPKFISIANLAHMLKMRLPNLQKRMEELGFTDKEHDHIIDAETAGLIADELGYEVIVNDVQGEDIFPSSPDPNAPLRPPIVTIMGHVDHGKTTILDYLRKSSVAAGEHGGITQHIGAFSVPVNGKQICFLDTPGHAAFLNMRQRGADVTDIVILVVAADDAVMPQTKEAIKHANNAGVPMIVAINKSDLPDADIDKVIADLAANEVDVEPFGGDTQVIPVSGLKGTNIDKLEEAILTLSEILEVKAPATGNAEGWIIESEVKKGVGNAATVLVRQGELKPGSFIVAGTKWCKVRSLTNDQGKRVKVAGPGTPVEVQGWKELPEAGDEVLQANNEQHAKRVVDNRIEREAQLQQSKDVEVFNEKRKQQMLEQERRAEREERLKLGLDLLPEDDAELEGLSSSKDKLTFIVKADVSGSAEAVKDSIQGLGNDDIEASVLYSAVGAVTESDVVRAESANAAILTFNLPKVSKDVALAASRKNVEILGHSIIYRLLEDVTNRLSAQLKPEIRHKVLAEAIIKDVFEITVKKSKKYVAGCRVTNGVLQRKSPVKVLRNREQIYMGSFSSMKHHKDEVSEAKKDTDCGLSFERWTDFQSGDVIQTYEEIQIQRHL